MAVHVQKSSRNLVTDGTETSIFCTRPWTSPCTLAHDHNEDFVSARTHECVVVQPLPKAKGTTLAPGTNEAIIFRETRINRVVLTKSSTVLAISPELGSLLAYIADLLSVFDILAITPESSKYRLYVKPTLKV